MSENNNKVTTEELVAYFWEQGDDITTKERVDVVLHAETLVGVSVMLRNVEDEVETMAQINNIGLVDMLVLYREGFAELNVIAERVV